MKRAYLFWLMIVFSGCVFFRSNAGTGARDINWLTQQLQEEGVFVSPQGPANLNLPAESSSRMILISQEVLEAYYFGDETTAQEEAVRLVNSMPQRDVYQTGRLVAIRYSARDTGLNATLIKILGRPL